MELKRRDFWFWASGFLSGIAIAIALKKHEDQVQKELFTNRRYFSDTL